MGIYVYVMYIYTPICIHVYAWFPRWLSGKELACQAGDEGSIPGLGRSPGGENGNPLQYSCLENPVNRRPWQVYSPQDCKELDTT